MADSILDGWLRICGEKFYALTRPRSVQLEDREGTLQDILDDLNVDDIKNRLDKMQKDFDSFRDGLDAVLDGIGAYNIQTGVYTATKDIINTLSTDPDGSRLDDNVMYLVTEDSSLISRVYTRVLWKTPTGETIKSETFIGPISKEPVQIPFYDRLEVSGRAYRYTPSDSVIYDCGTGKPSKQIKVPDDEASLYGDVYFTKNVVLELRPKS